MINKYHRDIVQFLGQNTKHKKMNTRELKKRKFEEYIRAIWGVVLYVVIFAILSSTVEEDRW